MGDVPEGQVIPQTPLALTGGDKGAALGSGVTKTRFLWTIENFVAFKEIVETRKIFSRCVPLP